MTDQYDRKYESPEGTAVDGLPRVKAIYIHPVKSCGPVEVDRALLTKSGFMYDRSFALATESPQAEDPATLEWRFISQRTKPNMALIASELWLPTKDSNPDDPLVQSGGCVVLTFPDLDTPDWRTRFETIFHTWSLSATPKVSCVVPLQITATQMDRFNMKMKTFRIHSRDAKGLDMGEVPSVASALPKLKKFLRLSNQSSLTILRCTPDTLVHTDKNLAPLQYIGTPAVHGYTDQQPININNLSSVHAVSALLPQENQPLNALRFRANIWITNTPAYEEETWKRYRILPKHARFDSSEKLRASVAPVLSVVCRTSRCTMPNVNTDTGKFETDIPLPEKKKGKPQPSTTLVQHRTIETGNKAALGYLGMHCVPEDRNLMEAEEQNMGLYVQVGDEIEVLERGVHLYGSTGNDY
ncbi:hypothetical protein PENANT_c003G04732 [Penicillium antarcticum]|uniref:MOSC domain-containing protein n=1 Tax=Penicillium antarcticum TaxID=416450 RepID=A0A1V6QHX0_9EURO|nr:hypothetical protein PENANT_c003G04732 [Penicillium antarcticum]